jgi:hypothetical protein
MKKLPGLLLLILLAAQTGCKKSADTISEVQAHIRYSDPAADGIGYYLYLDSTREVVIPVNLSSSWHYPTVDAAVAIKIVDAGRRFYYGMMPVTNNPGLRGVYIVTIRKL